MYIMVLYIIQGDGFWVENFDFIIFLQTTVIPTVFSEQSEQTTEKIYYHR